jgi:hypothetical protein
MAVTHFVPEVWSSKIFVRLRKNLVYGNVVNTDYQGEISAYGDQVKINEIGAITVNSYTAHSDITIQTLESAQKVLTIDQQKYFAFEIDDIENAQTNPKLMNPATDEAAYAIGDTIDQFIASKYSEAGIINATNLGTSGTGLTILSSTGNAITSLSYASRYADENNVPRTGRWMVIPPWFHQKLVIANTGTVSATATTKDLGGGVLIEGFVGRLWGFDLYVSNNVATISTVNAIMFGDRSAISYAGQISKIQAFEQEKRFNAAVKGLYVYGAKVVRPSSLGTLYAIEGA